MPFPAALLIISADTFKKNDQKQKKTLKKIDLEGLDIYLKGIIRSRRH